MRRTGPAPRQTGHEARVLLRSVLRMINGQQKVNQMQMQQRTIKILIVDDHPLFRDGLRQALSLEEDLQVIGYCEDGDTAIRTIRKMSRISSCWMFACQG